MKNLLLHIRYLVRSHDCVTIPGIGSFIAATLPALVDESRALFMPPTRYISFNSEINHNDGLIAASVARRDAVSFETAASRVEKAVEQMRRDLTQFRFIDFPGIGTLSLDAQGLLQFTPAQSAGFINPYAILQPVAMQVGEAAEEQLAPRRRPRIIRIGAGAMRVAASVAITVSLGALLFFPLRDSSTLPFIKAAIWPSTVGEVPATTAFVEKPQPEVELIFAEAPADGHEILSPGNTPASVETDAPVYGVVVGVFSDAEKAEAFIGDASGMTSFQARNGQFRVCAATASTMEECAAMASKYRTDGTWPEAWPARIR